jgi:hypothetical protein
MVNQFSARIDGYGMATEQELAANAYLIAAAPEMYAALTRILDTTDCNCDHGPECCAHVSPRDYNCPGCIAYIALAKAEGRT